MVEREIRFYVTEGIPPDGGMIITQIYLLRWPISFRIRLVNNKLFATLKIPWGLSRLEFEFRISIIFRFLFQFRFSRIIKARMIDGDLEIDKFIKPRNVKPPLIICECELADENILEDSKLRLEYMEARKPNWVKSWVDITENSFYSNASLSRFR